MVRRMARRQKTESAAARAIWQNCLKENYMIDWFRKLMILLLGVLIVSGCARDASKAQTTKPTHKGDDGGHSHERGKMLLADVGNKYHALLTAHLSPKGNELDIFFETQDDEKPTTAAIPVESFTAFVTVAGQEEAKKLVFTPAPADERPKDEKAGTYSHFVAKAEWMKADDILTVVVQLEVEGERYRVTWNKFNPKKYAHHEE